MRKDPSGPTMATLENSPRHSDAARNEHLSVTPGPIDTAEDSQIEGSSNNPQHKTLEIH